MDIPLARQLFLSITQGDEAARMALADLLQEANDPRWQKLLQLTFTIEPWSCFSVAKQVYQERNQVISESVGQYVVLHTALGPQWRRGALLSFAHLDAESFQRLLTIQAIRPRPLYQVDPEGTWKGGHWLPSQRERGDRILEWDSRPYYLALQMQCRSHQHCEHLVAQAIAGRPVPDDVFQQVHQFRFKPLQDLLPEMA
jgi:hypothetical protein